MLILDLYRLRPGPFRHAATSPQAPWLAALFLLGTGAAYGGLVAAVQRLTGATLQGVPAADIPAWILVGGNVASGVLVSLVLHVGVTLVVWLGVRAAGGPGGLGPLYRAVAYLAPVALPSLPYLAARAAGQSRPGFMFGVAVVAGLLGLGALYRLVRVTQGLGPVRSWAAVAVVAVFCGSVVWAAG